MTRCYAPVAYWIIAVCVSGWIGWYALPIFSVEKTNTPMLWQQRLTNFVGALVGWLVLWPLGVRYWGCLSVAGCTDVSVGWWDVFGGFIAFIGVTGYLPYTVIGLIRTVFEAGRRLAEIAAGFFKA